MSPAGPTPLRRLFSVLALAATLLGGERASAQELRGHGGPVRALAATVDGSFLLSGSFDTSVIAWSPREHRAGRVLRGHDGAVNAVAVDPRGATALSGGEEGRLIAWDLVVGSALWQRELGAKILTVALDPGRRLAAAGTGDGALHLLALDSGEVRARLELGGERPTAVLFSAAGELFVAGHLGGLRSIAGDPPEARERRPASGFALTDLALVGERTLAASAIDGTIRLFTLPDVEPSGELTGHDAPVLALAAEPGGKWLASGDLKGRIILWSLREQRAERVLEPHRGPVWDLAFSTAPLALWSGGNDAIVRRWGEGDPPPLPVEASEPAEAGTDAGGVAGERGAKLFRACVACHTVTADGGNRAGPTLYGLFGRKAGAVPGYPYSESLARSGIVWTDETIDMLFALGPETFTPGSKMPLQRMPDPGDRAALIAYLKRVTMPGTRTEARGR